MKNLVFLLLFFSLIGMMTSCDSETETVDDSTFGYDFFPVIVGKSWVYASDSIILTAGGTRRDTFRSFIREVVGDTLVDATGNTSFKLHRFFKRNEADAWISTNTWTCSIDKTMAIRTEENIRQVKLVFPIKKGLRWNANVFLYEDLTVVVGGEPIALYRGWNPRMEEIDQPYDFNGQQIPSIKVNVAEEDNILSFRDISEYYGKGIGLVRRDMVVYDSDGSRPSDAWETKAQKGFKHTLTLIEVN